MGLERKAVVMNWVMRLGEKRKTEQLKIENLLEIEGKDCRKVKRWFENI
jgi:hypothetical protein